METTVGEFPRTPLRSQRLGTRGLQHTQPPTRGSSVKGVAAAAVYTDTYPVSSGYGSHYDDGETLEFKAKEKMSAKEETKISITEDSGHHSHHHQKSDDCHQEKHQEKHHDKKESGGYATTTVCIILFVIFIIVFFVILGGLWWCKPDYTCDEGEDGKQFNYVSGALYALIIALFFIIILGAAWWACS